MEEKSFEFKLLELESKSYFSYDENEFGIEKASLSNNQFYILRLQFFTFLEEYVATYNVNNNIFSFICRGNDEPENLLLNLKQEQANEDFLKYYGISMGNGKLNISKTVLDFLGIKLIEKTKDLCPDTTGLETLQIINTIKIFCAKKFQSKTCVYYIFDHQYEKLIQLANIQGFDIVKADANYQKFIALKIPNEFQLIHDSLLSIEKGVFNIEDNKLGNAPSVTWATPYFMNINLPNLTTSNASAQASQSSKQLNGPKS